MLRVFRRSGSPQPGWRLLLGVVLWAGCHSSSPVGATVTDAGHADVEEAVDTNSPWAPYANRNSDELFDPEQVRTIELKLRDEDLAFLDADPMAEEYVPGELVFEGATLGPVGIRYKGSTGAFVGCLSGGFLPPSGSKVCPKLGMKIKIDYASDDDRFYGQKKLVFHAMNHDRSLMRERLGYGLYREMGVAASRAVHVRLVINGQLSGVYLMVEEIDGRFTRHHFGDGGQGNLYKQMWPVSQDEEPYLAALETNRGEKVNARKIVSLARALAEADDSTLPEVVERWMDTDYIARLIAVDRTIKHDDGQFHWYCRPLSDATDWHHQHLFETLECGNHNYFWYEDTRADRLWLIPWDLDDSMLVNPGFSSIRTEWDDLSYACDQPLPNLGIIPGQLPPTCDPLQRGWALGLRDKVHAAARELLAGPLAEETILAKFRAWAEQVAPIVEEASALYPREPSVPQWQGEVESLLLQLQGLREQAPGQKPEMPEGSDRP